MNEQGNPTPTPPCPSCAALTVRRGTRYKCLSCGHSIPLSEAPMTPQDRSEIYERIAKIRYRQKLLDMSEFFVRCGYTSEELRTVTYVTEDGSLVNAEVIPFSAEALAGRRSQAKP